MLVTLEKVLTFFKHSQYYPIDNIISQVHGEHLSPSIINTAQIKSAYNFYCAGAQSIGEDPQNLDGRRKATVLKAMTQMITAAKQIDFGSAFQPFFRDMVKHVMRHEILPLHKVWSSMEAGHDNSLRPGHGWYVFVCLGLK